MADKPILGQILKTKNNSLGSPEADWQNPVSVNTAITNPTGTASATAVMMGIGKAVTPTGSGNILCIVTFEAANSSTGGLTADLRFGTGTAPANAAAVTGTLVGKSKTLTAPGANNKFTVTLTGIIPATLAANWVDVSLLAITAGTATITNVDMVLLEI